MTSERWQQIETVFQAALDRPPNERAAVIREACQHDTALLAEVTSLLASFEQAGNFMNSPVAEDWGFTQPALAQGQRLGHYAIIAPLGQGGMGEVYLAEDTRLKRRIALKLLSARFMNDAQFVERFEHEARAASALNHPNIITVHDIGCEAGMHFMATEYIEGETLRARLERAPLEEKETLALAAQIAEALSAAHTAGVIHRDIKPENVMIRPDGLVKVLDFGLAKPLEGRSEDHVTFAPFKAESLADRLPPLHTDPHVLMGTLRYLAPEQVRYETADQRTDVFSLGVVLYEMLAGRQPFIGQTTAEVLRAIQHDEPVPLPARVSSPLAALVARALAKERAARWSSASELKAALARCVAPSNAPPTSRRKRLAVTASLLLLALSGFWVWRTSRASSSLPASFASAAAHKLTDLAGQELFPSLAPDGQSVIFASLQSGNWDIYHQPIGARAAVNLTAQSISAEIQPALSPDGKKIAFRSWNYGTGLFVMNSDGSQIERLNDFGFNPNWSPDGREIAFADEVIWDFEGRSLHSRLWAVNVASRARRLITEQDAVQPNWSPHGQRIAFWGQQKGSHRDIWTIAADGGTATPVTDDAFIDWNPVWSPTGEHLYFLSNRGGEMNLWRVAIEEATGQLRGVPEPATLSSNDCQYVSFARNGTALVYSQVNRTENLWQIAFDPVAGQVRGTAEPLTQGLKRYANFTFAPDEKRFVYLARGEPQQDLFIADLNGQQLQRLTDDVAQDLAPHWSPDGQRIAFISDRSGQYEIWQVQPDGNGLTQLTHGADKDHEAVGPVWLPNAKQLLYQLRNREVYVMNVGPADAAPALERLPGTPPAGFYPTDWSPNGAFLAGYLTPTPQEQRRAIVVYERDRQRYTELSGQGFDPKWLNDNRHLLYRQSGKLYWMDAQPDANAKPQVILTLKADRQIGSFALSRDNRRIYYSEVSSESDIWMLPLK
jgi:eukaryotic-like serine/threonine-protein kinase